MILIRQTTLKKKLLYSQAAAEALAPQTVRVTPKESCLNQSMCWVHRLRLEFLFFFASFLFVLSSFFLSSFLSSLLSFLYFTVRSFLYRIFLLICFSFLFFTFRFFSFLFYLPSFLHPGVEGNPRKQLHHMTDLQPSHSLWHSMWGSYQQDKPSQQDAVSISPNYTHLCSDHLWSMPIIHGHWSPNI